MKFLWHYLKLLFCRQMVSNLGANIAVWLLVLFLLHQVFPLTSADVVMALVLIFVLHGAIPSFIAALAGFTKSEKLFERLLCDTSWVLFLTYEAFVMAGSVLILRAAGLSSLKWAIGLGLFLTLPVFLAMCLKKLAASKSG